MKNFLLALILVLFITSISYTQNVPSYIPTDNLFGWWPFNGNANDESGNGNNGIVNGATLTTDRYGLSNKAYSFNGINQFIGVALTDSLNIASYSGITFSAWVSLNNLASYSTLFDFYGANGGFGLIYKSNIQRISALNAKAYQNPLIELTSLIQPPSNTWIYVLFTVNFNTSISQLYINGVLQSQSTTNPFLPNLGYIGIGRWTDVIPWYASGKLDEIGIWTRAFSAEEVSQVFTSTIKGNIGVNTVEPQRNLHVKDVMRLEPRNQSPESPKEGDIYYDAILKKLRVFDGAAWQNCW
ncbi:MAG: LamG domain-containing protein [Saprospiraceae bacterium]|nr:LamG domain-containing protein [Saprospiraceae bacterium]MBP7643212.1 LamG domain-containing protein [Saprospiraceae bacterium]